MERVCDTFGHKMKAILSFHSFYSPKYADFMFRFISALFCVLQNEQFQHY